MESLVLNDKAKQAMEDILNIAMRDKLWQHADVKLPEGVFVCDGGSSSYHFEFGENRGSFNRRIDASSKDLELFFHKVKIWQTEVYYTATGEIRK